MSDEQFHNITLGEPPRELAVKLIEYLQDNKLILDCGCGAGNDTLFFISKGHNVIALDRQVTAIEERFNKLDDLKNKVKIIESNICDFELDKIDCFYSSLTLSFLQRKDFYKLWDRIISLPKGAIISINIFGDRDEWYRETEEMTFMNSEEFKELFSKLTILDFIETEKIGTSMGNEGLIIEKKWHTFQCIAII